MRTRKYRILSRVSSVLVVVCLLAAPLCATRCALSSCAKPNTHEQSTTGCHHQSMLSRGSSVLAGAIAATCLPADSLLTSLPAPQFRHVLTDSHSQGLSAVLNSQSSSAAALIAFRITSRSSSHGDSSSLVSNLPLRL